MELTDYLRVFRKYWVSVTSIVLVGVAASAVLSLLTKPTYTASSSIFLTVQSGTTAGELNSGSTYAENQVRSFARVVTSPIVLQPVIDRLQLGMTPEQFAKMVVATVPTSTAIIEISVTSRDPAETATIADQVAAQTIATVDKLSPAGPGGSKSVQATVISPAAVPTVRTTPKVAMNISLGLLLGLVLGAGQAILRATLDTRIRNNEDVAQVTDSSVIGTIGLDPEATPTQMIVQDPHSQRAEAYRRLRTNLQFLDLGNRSNSIVITSSIAGEGKTTTCINTAVTVADAGQSVLLMDADLRRPCVAASMSLEGTVGLTTVLIGRAELSDVVQPFGNGNLHVLPAGQIPPNPSELLGSDAMKRLLKQATAEYDLVLIDSPPLLPVTDSAILSTLTGGVVVVVGSGTVTQPQLRGALDSLEDVDGTVLGLVLNKVRIEDSGYYRYHHEYHRKVSGKTPGTVEDGVRQVAARAVPASPTEALATDPARAH